MKIELLKPPAGAKGYSRGERIIAVDGVRWGRTVVSSHGVHGQKHRFRQDNADGVIHEPTGDTRPHYKTREAAVWSTRKVWHRDGQQHGDIWERIMAKVRELIDAGLLIHPEKQKQRNDTAHANWLRKREEQERKSEQAMRDRAEAVVGVTFKAEGEPKIMIMSTREELVARIIEAMKWAQTQ